MRYSFAFFEWLVILVGKCLCSMLTYIVRVSRCSNSAYHTIHWDTTVTAFSVTCAWRMKPRTVHICLDTAARSFKWLLTLCGKCLCSMLVFIIRVCRRSSSAYHDVNWETTLSSQINVMSWIVLGKPFFFEPRRFLGYLHTKSSSSSCISSGTCF